MKRLLQAQHPQVRLSFRYMCLSSRVSSLDGLILRWIKHVLTILLQLHRHALIYELDDDLKGHSQAGVTAGPLFSDWMLSVPVLRGVRTRPSK
jgi:hypothetical protein